MTSAKRSLKVFLCHGSEDKTTVRLLYQQLSNNGVEPWLDEKDILPGQEWDREIRKAVRGCDAVLVCLSQSSMNKSGYLQKEIRFVLDVADEKPDGTIFLIPVRLESIEMPERLRRWQWVNYFEENGSRLLMDALRFHANTLGINLHNDAMDAAEAVQGRMEEERQQREELDSRHTSWETTRPRKISGTNESNVGAEPLYGTALVDATSVAFICQDRCIRMATDPAVKLLRNKDTAVLLRILEWAVVYNLQAHDLALYSLGVDPVRLTKTYGNLINPTEISRETLIGASQRVEQIRDLVNEQRQELSTSPLCPWGDEPVKHAPYAITQAWPRPLETLGRIEVRGERGIYEFGSAEKIYFDRCVTNDLPRVQAIARSNDDAERALFYAELSDMLSTPVLLSDGKQQWLQEVKLRTLTDLQALISKVIDDEAKRVIVSRLTDADILPGIVDVPYPPLAEMIVRQARSRQCSLVEAAQEIMVSPGAVAYRSKLAQFYSYAKLGRAGQDKLTALIGEIQCEFHNWYEKEDKTVTSVKLQLAKIPRIGWLFELIGLAETTITLPKHQRENPYLSFIFDWYRPQQGSE